MPSRMMFVRVYPRAFFKGACGRGIYDTRIGDNLRLGQIRPGGDTLVTPSALRPVLRL